MLESARLITSGPPVTVLNGGIPVRPWPSRHCGMARRMATKAQVTSVTRPIFVLFRTVVHTKGDTAERPVNPGKGSLAETCSSTCSRKVLLLTIGPECTGRKVESHSGEC